MLVGAVGVACWVTGVFPQRPPTYEGTALRTGDSSESDSTGLGLCLTVETDSCVVKLIANSCGFCVYLTLECMISFLSPRTSGNFVPVGDLITSSCLTLMSSYFQSSGWNGGSGSGTSVYQCGHLGYTQM